MVKKDLLEEYVPILRLIPDHLLVDPSWSLTLLETVSARLIKFAYTEERDTTSDVLRAIYCAEIIVDRFGGEINDLMILAQLLAKADRFEDALDRLDAALKFLANDSEYYRLRAIVLEKLNKIYLAEEAIEKSVTLSPCNQSLLEEKARINGLVVKDLREIRNNSVDLAASLRAAELIVGKYSSEASDIFYFANLLSKCGRLEEALNRVIQVIKISPHEPDYYLFQALTLEKLGRYWSAMQSINVAISLVPKNENFRLVSQRIRFFYILRKFRLLWVYKIVIAGKII